MVEIFKNLKILKYGNFVFRSIPSTAVHYRTKKTVLTNQPLVMSGFLFYKYTYIYINIDIFAGAGGLNCGFGQKCYKSIIGILTLTIE